MESLRNNKIFLFIFFGIIFICLSFGVLLKGPIKVSLQDLFSYFFNDLSEPLIKDVIHEIRIPKTVTAIFAGASLATSGLLMQTFFQISFTLLTFLQENKNSRVENMFLTKYPFTTNRNKKLIQHSHGK